MPQALAPDGILGAVVDSDAHVFEPHDLWERFLDPRFRPRAPKVVLDEQGRIRWDLDGRLTPPLPRFTVPAEDGSRVPYVPRPGMGDPREHVADMDREGIRQAVVYPGIGLLFQSIADGELAAALCRAYNDWLREHCSAAPGRLFGAAAIPLQDVRAAVAEIERVAGADELCALFIRPNPVGGRLLHDPELDPFWRAAADARLPVAIHEGTTRSSPTVAQDRYDARDEPFFFLHMLSHPFEQQLACLNLIAGGVLDRHPALRVVFLESGSAWTVHWLARMDEHFEHWGYTLPALERRPSDVFRSQCFISTDPEEDAVAATAEYVGEDCIVWASDYPHPDAVFPGAARATLANPRLGERQKRKILVDNGRRLYGFPGVGG
jgi:predicted TIM-barrel fold metal-dependent hydrolase